MGDNKKDALLKKRIITNNHTRAEFEVINQKRANNGFDMTIFKEVDTDNADKAREF